MTQIPEDSSSSICKQTQFAQDQVNEAEDDFVQTSSANKRLITTDLLAYIAIIYFVVVGVGYIIVQYAFIIKYQFPLTCNPITKICGGRIDNIMVKNKIYFELRSATEKDLQEEVFIDSIQLINSTKPYDLELINDDYNNCYPYYRRLWGSINYQLIYGYNISVSFNNTIPDPFFDSLTAILRQDQSLNEDSTISMALICMVFASIIALYNIFNKTTDNGTKQSPNITNRKRIYKIYHPIPEDILELEKDFEKIRQQADINLTILMRQEQQKSIELTQNKQESQLSY